MNEEQILDRARREVAARRAAEAAVRGRRLSDSTWRWLPLALALAVLVAFFATPGQLPRRLLLAMGGVCSLRPAHSYFAGGVQLPLEARMTGIYGGFMLTLAVLLLFGRLGARRLGGKVVAGLLLLMFAAMVFDGINSTLAEVGLPHLYEPTNALRLVTGLLSGIALAPFLVWLLGLIAVPREANRRVVIRSAWELLMPVAINAGFAGVVLNGHGVFFLPIALVSVTGIVAVLAGVALLVVLLISGLEGRVTQLRQLVAPGGVALLVAFGVLAGTAMFRWSVTGSPY